MSNSADVGQPAGADKTPDQHGAEGVGCVAPQVMAAVGSLNVLMEAKPLSRRDCPLMRQAHQHARHGQADESPSSSAKARHFR